MKKIVKLFTVILAFFLSFNVVYAENDENTGKNGDTKTYTYSTKGKTWKQVNGNTWNMDLNDDGKADVTLTSSEDAKGNTVWTYTFNVEDNTQAYYVYEAMKGADSTAGVSNGYTTKGSDDKQAIAVDPGQVDPKTHSYTITNKKDHSPVNNDKGTLKISKSVEGTMPNPSQKFDFTIQLNGNKISGTQIFGDVPFQNGTGTVSIGNGENKVITDIPAGTGYTVTEAAVSGYNFPADKQSGIDEGTIQKDVTSESSWTNSVVIPQTPPRSTHNLYLEKKVDAGESVNLDKDEKYDFLVSFQNLEKNTSYSVVNASGDNVLQNFVSDDSGEADVKLSLNKDQKVKFADIPENATYMINESAGKDYISSYKITGNDGGSLEEKNNQYKNTALSTSRETVSQDATVTFTNTYPSVQSLTVENRWMKLENGKLIIDEKDPKPFEVTVHFSKVPRGAVIQSDATGDMTPDDYGEIDQTFTMGKDQDDLLRTVHFTDIPAGVQYKITQGALKDVTYKPSYQISVKDSTGKSIEGTVSRKNDSAGISSALSTQTETLEDGQNDTVVLTNVPETNFGIIKKDKDGKPVSDAQYQLYRYDPDTKDKKTVDDNVRTTDKDGFAGWTNVEDGVYILTETKAAKGYTIGDDVVFKLENGKSTKYCTSDDSLNDAEKVANSTITADLMKDWSPDKHTVSGTVYDAYPVTEGMLVKLPSTGGIGLFVTLIIALILIGAGFWLNHKGKGKKIVAMFLLGGLLLSTFNANSVPVHADDSYQLNVQFDYDQKPVAGGTFAVTKVADLNVDKQKYKVVDAFSSLKPDFTDTSVQNYKDLAEEMKDVAVNNDTSISKEEQKTDDNGKASFTITKPGMYLVWQTGKEGKALNFKDAEPSLISVPNYDGKEWQNTVTYSVKTEPDYQYVDFTGQKQWENDTGQENQRPDKVTLYLTKKNDDGSYSDVRDVKPVTASSEDDWKFSFDHVGIMKDETDLSVYSVREDPVTDYTLKDVSFDAGTKSFTVVNTYTPKLINITGKKTWNDQKYIGKDGYVRPSEIDVTLTGVNAEGQVIVSQSEKVTEADGWTYTFENVPAYDQGQEVTYSVTETGIDGKTPEEAGYDSVVSDNGRDITNTPVKEEPAPTPKPTVTPTPSPSSKPGSVTVNDPPVSKVITGDRPSKDSVFRFTMKADDPADPMPEGSENGVKTVSHTGEGSIEFGNITFTKPGKYEYTISELNDQIPGYQYDTSVFKVKYVISQNSKGNLESLRTMTRDGNQVDQAEFRNQYTAQKNEEKPGNPVTLTITKRDGESEKHGVLTGAEFVIQKDGSDHKITGKTNVNGQLTLNLKESGTYTLKETKAPKGYQINDPLKKGLKLKVDHDSFTVKSGKGYVFSYVSETHQGFLTVNDSPQKSDITGEIQWNDGKDQDGIRKDPELHLYQIIDGKTTEISVVKVPKNTTKQIWKDMPLYIDGKKVTYLVTEDPIPKYQTEVSGNQIDHFIFINTHQPVNPVPNTGDHNNVPLFTGMLGGSALILGLILMFRRKFC